MKKYNTSAFALLVTMTSAIACVAPATNDTGADGGKAGSAGSGGASGSTGGTSATGGTAGNTDCKIGEPCTPGAVCKSDKNIVCAPCLDMWLTKAKSDELCSNADGGGNGGSGGGNADLCKPGPCPTGYVCSVRNGKETCDPNGTGGSGGSTADLCKPGPCPTGFDCVIRNGKESCDPVSNGTGGTTGTGGSTGGTRTLEVHFTGNTPGSLAIHRYCMGSPITKGYTGPDKENENWLPWPGQVLSANNDQTWRSFHGDVNNASTEYVQTIVIPADSSLELQCYDEKNGAITNWACVAPSSVGLTVKEGGTSLPISLVDNLYGSKNCRIY